MTIDVDHRLAELERRVTALEAARGASPPTPTNGPEGKPSPREFLLERAPKSDNDRTLTAGYYIEIIGGAESFNFDGIEDFFGAAKEAVPANRRDPPYQNVKKGYFREVGPREVGMKARNRWALTNLGIARVEGGFGAKK